MPAATQPCLASVVGLQNLLLTENHQLGPPVGSLLPIPSMSCVTLSGLFYLSVFCLLICEMDALEAWF